MFTFCPLQGALSDSTASQSLLELDGGVKVLVDLGWDETFNVEKLKEIEKYVPLRSYFRGRIMMMANKIYALDKLQLYHSFSLHMRRPRILLPTPIAVKTSRSSRAFPYMRHDPSSTLAAPSSKIFTHQVQPQRQRSLRVRSQRAHIYLRKPLRLHKTSSFNPQPTKRLRDTSLLSNLSNTHNLTNLYRRRSRRHSMV